MMVYNSKIRLTLAALDEKEKSPSYGKTKTKKKKTRSSQSASMSKDELAAFDLDDHAKKTRKTFDSQNTGDLEKPNQI
jgi:hypothetical protein